MKRPKRDPVREDRIYNEAIVDARPEEQAMSWYYYLEGKISFPFQARCVAANAVSPLRKGETVEVLRMAVADACEHDMFVQTVGWSGKWQSLSLNCAPSIQTNQPKKPSATAITGSRRATACNLRTATESSRSSGQLLGDVEALADRRGGGVVDVACLRSFDRAGADGNQRHGSPGNRTHVRRK